MFSIRVESVQKSSLYYIGLVLASSLPLDVCVCVHCVHSALLHSAGQEEKLPVCRSSSSSRHYSSQGQQNSDDCPLYFLLYMEEMMMPTPPDRDDDYGVVEINSLH